jgi:ribosomal protein S18 acetylase RimI-like enzyme
MLKAATEDRDFDDARTLFREHAAALGCHFCFVGFEQELADLPTVYAPPRGVLLLAIDGEELHGCVGFRDLGDGVCEMKRLFVRPAARGRAYGRQLVDEIVARAAAVGYREMRLDTLPSMQAAFALYRQKGFVEIEPYYDNPVPDVTFMSLDLRALAESGP